MPYSEIRIVASLISRIERLFRTYRGQNEFVHWIGRFEIAQKRFLASWADLIDLTDLPDVGAAEFLTALTDEQCQHYQQLPNDEERIISSHPSGTNNNESASTTSTSIPTVRQFDVTDFLSSIRPE